jgi:hypothetical protein
MVAEEFFVNCFNFNPITLEKKVSYIKLSGAGPDLKLDLEPKEIFSVPQH